jgi:hypothetical protein
MHSRILSMVLKELIDNNIPAMEYGSQIVHRWGWEGVLVVVSDEHFPSSKLRV